MYFGELLAYGNGFQIAVWGIYVGVIIASLLALYEKRLVGKFVRALLEKEALSPEKALSLAELGFGGNAFIKRSLRGKTALSSLVYMPGEDTGLPEHPAADDPLHPRPAIRARVDFAGENAKFYIPEPLRHRASLRYEQHGTHIMGVVMAVLAFAGAALLLLWGLPKAMELAKDIFSSLLATV